MFVSLSQTKEFLIVPGNRYLFSDEDFPQKLSKRCFNLLIFAQEQFLFIQEDE
jgi:hypothetical protein